MNEDKIYPDPQDKKPEKESAEHNSISRRNMLKAFAGIPIAGLLGFEVFRKLDFSNTKKRSIQEEFGLDNMALPISDYGEKPAGKLLRIGLVGFGRRGVALLRALGFMHPDEIAKRKNNNTYDKLLQQEDLNVEIAGICDVFDLHAIEGVEVASSNIHHGKTKSSVKRYSTYQEMLDDENIDAIVISTPDHQHAQMAIDAAKANKHVYLEKTAAHTEKELNDLYDVIKNSNIKFQIGHQVTQSAVFKQAKEIIDKDILGKITLVETTTNRNTPEGAWIRHIDKTTGEIMPGSEKTIDWERWLGSSPYVPFSIERYYNWTQWFAYDTGMIGQLFSHEFDAVNSLLNIGIPKSVTSSGGIYYWKDNREIPDSLNCVFEYPDRDLTLLYSGNLASSRSRGRIFMGNDASMELGNNIKVTVDSYSTRYKKSIDAGVIDTTSPMLSFNPNAGQVDAITSASELYYAERGLTDTVINGRQVDVTHLHMREWLDCIREDKTPSGSIDVAFDAGITCLMANIAYMEKRQVMWDEENRRIV